MTTSNPFDLSSFEPEAILAALPGEHPKMTAALGVGRELEQTGQLDIDTLTNIVNDLYAEGFPTESPFTQKSTVPTTDSLTHDISAQPISLPLSQASIESIHAQQLQYAPLLGALQDFTTLDLAQLQGGGTSLPYEADIAELFSAPNSINALATAPTSNLPQLNLGSSSTSQASKPSAGQFYFLQANGIETSPFQQSGNIAPSAHPPFDANLVRKDFPILRELVNGRPLVWFDNAATTQKPQAVIDRISYFYQHENSNIHRAAHELAARATDAYEDARESVRRFINAPSVDNIIFVRGTTEAINLVAKTWGKKHLGEGDEVLISHLEHHANIVPWQQLCLETGAKLKVAPVDDSGQVILEEYQKLLTSRTKLVSFTQVSNALGTVTPAKEMIAMAHHAGAKVLLDGAQSVSHMRSDVQALNPDFFVFSGHKVFGPTGIGALYGKADVLADMPAWQGGGNMIQDVTFEKTIYHAAPAKFEAGTGNIADAVGLGAALEYVERIGIDNIARYEHELLVYATVAMCQVPGLTLIGTAKEKASVLSFTLNGYQSEEVGAALNAEGIAVRSGHHCAQPILRRFGLETTVRPSLAFYNTYEEIDRMVRVIKQLSQQQAH
ncbi:MAG TPA: aminotransferase class V [Methylophilaceae bacterium]|nr:aminotransferase class V [Methylophilaceae bacterium]HAJ70933.1 aminotransferase class V [Methylophilaceae bacterium]